MHGDRGREERWCRGRGVACRCALAWAETMRTAFYRSVRGNEVQLRADASNSVDCIPIVEVVSVAWRPSVWTTHPVVKLSLMGGTEDIRYRF